MFKRILYPTDFSEPSAKALAFVLDIAQAYNSEVVILFTYRLLSSGGDGKLTMDKVSHKREQEKLANRKFEELKQSCPQLLKVKHTFFAEVGFITDRMSLAIDKFNIDLVVISESIQPKLKEKWEKIDDNLPARFHCPILLIPAKLQGEPKLVPAE